MKYFYIETEVAGGLGENTAMDRSVHPPIVTDFTTSSMAGSVTLFDKFSVFHSH